ncbi:tRNA pseudouridine(13) synthase TruD [Luteimonas sp. RD2P54]|uniref:tRNA pseudouridine synthase D n=1 Tax=Luteimonas endophytica TaxID=3042023 RepID=A0ABT6JDX1_9GAMM|nr:tRNA pseudouridine(13) synthase TruD [Luteimonas endophytica]MDH5824398.1 tRNA pseudouridine(13) synthase TruD [Luteimonas endophytica]
MDAPASGGLPAASGDAVLEATIRAAPEDFQVEELAGFEASGSGEHLLLTVEKRGMNTAFAAARIADWAGVPVSAVGYAGLKDRHALTRQRFSVHLPGRDAPPVETLEHGARDAGGGPALRVLERTRHARKLPRGALAGNRFVLTLRGVLGDPAAIDARLATIAASGVPNYFGEQRFGRGGGNVAAAMAMFAGRRVRRDQRSHLLSAARSELFNRVLAARVRDGSWNRGLEGEVWILDGSRSVFGPEPWSALLEGRLRDFDIHPSAPLWGAGELRSREQARCLECAALAAADAVALRDGLERAGLRQERRATRLRPVSMRWERPEAAALRLAFELPAGAYATAVLAELGTLRNAADPHA